MKKQLFTLFMAVMAFTQTAFAQEFKVKKDTAYVDGKALCVVKDRMFGTEYRILSRKGKELIFGKLETIGAQGFFTLSFLENDVQCEREVEMGFGKKLVRELYERGALTLDADTLDATGLKKFLMTHTRKFSEEGKEKAAQQAAAKEANNIRISTNSGGNTSNSIKLVERNTGKRVSVGFGKVEQDFKTIGTYKEESVGVTGKKIIMSTPEGEVVAELVFKSLSDKNGKIFTFADRRDYDFTIEGSNSASKVFNDYAQFLIDRRYL